MDATQANIWNIKATFKSDEYGLLSGVLEDAISSWSMEVAAQGTAEESKSTGAEKQRRSYTSLLWKGARFIQGSIAMVDNSDVEEIISILFAEEDPPAISTILDQNTDRIRGSASSQRLVSASELGLHLPQATIVPYNSLLWKMLEHLVDVISPNSKITYPTSFMGFMKAVWAEVLKQTEEHWRGRKMIPLVDVFGGLQESRPPADDSILNSPLPENNDNDPRTAAIDLRFNLVHQKLCMINCCIARELNEKKNRRKLRKEKEQRSKEKEQRAKEKKAKSVSLPKEGSQTTLEPEQVEASSSDISQETKESVAPPISQPVSLTPSPKTVIDVQINEDMTMEPEFDTQAQGAGVSGSKTPEIADEGLLSDFKGLTLLETGSRLVIPQLQVSNEASLYGVYPEGLITYHYVVGTWRYDGGHDPGARAFV